MFGRVPVVLSLVSGLAVLLSVTTHADDAAATQAKKTVTVAITQIVEHPALDAVRQGVQDELIASGYTEGDNLNWTFESAQGNPATAAQIARKFAGDKPDVIVAIATPSAQTVVAAVRNIPVVFSAVTDPVGAKLVTSLEKPGANVTGTTDMLPMSAHIDLLKRLLPQATRVGTVYNPGESNSVSSVESLEKELQVRQMTLIKASATKSSDVLAAARSLVGKVDVIYLTTDNTVISAVEAVISVGEKSQIPVIAADTDTVKRGAVAALGFDYYRLGRDTGDMVVEILKGTAPGGMPVRGITKLDLVVNADAAKRMGLSLSPDILAEAKEVIGTP